MLLNCFDTSTDRLRALEMLKHSMIDVSDFGFLVARSFLFSADEERARAILLTAVPPRTATDAASAAAAAYEDPC